MTLMSSSMEPIYILQVCRMNVIYMCLQKDKPIKTFVFSVCDVLVICHPALPTPTITFLLFQLNS